jgi:hypothetical protein
MSDLEEFRKKVNDWLDEYPARRGVIVFFDGNTFKMQDWSNLPGHHAAEFATKYRDFVLKNVGLDDFMYEELDDGSN